MVIGIPGFIVQTEPAFLTESVEVHIGCGDVLSQGIVIEWNGCVCRDDYLC